jgi:hypothetical protein
VSNPIPGEAGWFLDEYDGERFWSHVDIHGGTSYSEDPLATASGECWTWRGVKGNDYIQFILGGRKWLAHIVAYREFGNKIPEGDELDHLCRIITCVNPAHLQAVPHAENVSRGLVGRDANPACPSGHAWTPDNTLWHNQNGRKVRVCRTCSITRNRVRNAQKSSR